MKKIILSIVAVVALVALPASVFAQANLTNTNNADDVNSTASSAVGAKIITPIKIEKSGDDLNFGTITTPTAETNVVVTAANVRSSSNSEILLASGPSTVPTFTVTGETGLAFTLQLPDDDDVKLDGDGDDMVVKTFTSNLGTATTILADGNPFQVGATLVVGANQARGTYAGTFNVTVAYN